MAIGISPLVDFAFKRMLGNPEHSGITIHFLNSILVDQELLGQRIWSAEEFSACYAAQLNAMADQPQQQLRARNSWQLICKASLVK